MNGRTIASGLVAREKQTWRYSAMALSLESRTVYRKYVENSFINQWRVQMGEIIALISQTFFAHQTVLKFHTTDLF